MRIVDHNEIKEFRRTLRQLEQLLGFQAGDRCGPVSMPQCHLILEIEAAGETSASELCDRLFLDKSTLSRTIDTLVTRGLVVRTQDPNDRRVVRLCLTDEGRSCCDKVNRKNDDYFAKVLDEMPAQKRAHVTDAIRALVEALDKRRCEGERCSPLPGGEHE
jgi:DNA-binding MarR family transcriptional regulator